MLTMKTVWRCPLQDRDAADRANGGLCCHFFNTFFLNKLYMDANEYSYKNVSRSRQQCAVLIYF